MGKKTAAVKKKPLPKKVATAVAKPTGKGGIPAAFVSHLKKKGS